MRRHPGGVKEFEVLGMRIAEERHPHQGLAFVVERGRGSDRRNKGVRVEIGTFLRGLTPQTHASVH